jgi:hypothetical protein
MDTRMHRDTALLRNAQRKIKNAGPMPPIKGKGMVKYQLNGHSYFVQVDSIQVLPVLNYP